MTKPKREPLDIRIQKLAKALEGEDPERLRSVLVKDKTLTIRISETDRLELRRTAKECGLTVTEYLMRLHWFAIEMLKGGRRGATPPGTHPTPGAPI